MMTVQIFDAAAAFGETGKVKNKNIAADPLYKSQREYYRAAYAAGPAPWDNAFDTGWLEREIEKLGPARGRRALDMGCGRGKGAGILTKAGWRAVGMDYLIEPLRHAGRRPAALVNADVFKPPFRAAAFDLVLDFGVFHHTRRRDTAVYIEVMTSLLAPSGAFLLGCFSTRFRHKGEGRRKRNWTIHHGHYDRFSARGELIGLFSPFFAVNSIEESPDGFYHVAMTRKIKP